MNCSIDANRHRSDVMIDKSKLAFRMEFRAATGVWIPVVICQYHTWLLGAHVDVRPRAGGTLPKSQCQYCIAMARTLERLKLEGKIKESPLRHRLAPSVRKKVA
jgi:hypothetical protein